MHKSVQNLNIIKKKIKDRLNNIGKKESPNIVAVSKTFPIKDILPLINSGHLDFGENKVQETLDKWYDLKQTNKNINLHLIGKLQRNKVKFAVKIFDYIHSVDNEKLAKKISDEMNKINRSIKIFIQVNIGDEGQKSGVNKQNLSDLVSYCNEIKLNVVGLMCIPPINSDPDVYFSEMSLLNKTYYFDELSMGMSADFQIACKNKSTYLRIGSSIFGERN